jgi:hypothetical protein
LDDDRNPRAIATRVLDPHMEGDFHGHDGIRRWWQALLDA